MKFETLQRMYMDLTGDAVVVGCISPGCDVLRVAYINKGFTRLFGYAPEDLRGRSFEEVGELQTTLRLYDAIAGEETGCAQNLSTQSQFTRADGTQFWASISFLTTGDNPEEDRYICATYREISALKDAEAKATRSRARLMAALDAYPSPFAIYDKDDCLIVWNDAYSRSMTDDPAALYVGMHRTEAARIAIEGGKIVQAIGKEKEWASLEHQEADVAKPVQDLELAGDIHHRLLRSRAKNGDLVMLRIDTTELVRQRRALEAVQERLVSAINAYPDPFAIYDASHNLVVWNPAYARSVTDTPEKLRTGTNLKDLLRQAAYCGRIPAARGREEEWLQAYYSPHLLDRSVEDFEFADGQHFRIVRSKTKNGEYVVLRLNITEVVNQRRAVERYTKKLERANEEISHIAGHDALTGLGNRRHLSHRFQQLAESRCRQGGEIAMLHIDLDRFKQINDTMGHAAGDHVLLETANRIRNEVEPQDVIARIGGDEFVVLLRFETGSTRPFQLATTLLKELQMPVYFEGKECRFGASIGVAETPLSEVDKLLTNSDIALYKAKRAGRGRLGFFDRSDLQDILKRKTMADDILRAIEQDEFVPYYQPQIDAETGHVAGVEVLARWQHPQKGIVLPEAFLAIATDLNITASIDELIFEKAMKDCEGVLPRMPSCPSLSFNVSASRVRENSINDIRARVSGYSGKICFELLETMFVEEEDDAFLFQLDRLRDIGITIEIDDFGSGNASVVALQRIAPDRLKIDGRLIAQVTESDSGLRLVRSIVEIGLALEMGVTAEGVETREQAAVLADLGCDRLQGFLFAKPMPFEDLLSFFARDASTGFAGN
ncbi:GGDEF domain-containing protein [Roseobacter denitrificans]|uniref:GGDEF/EAL domain protein n=2 Tax=Roseobacter denitrificans TaxID=2434 RepID=Q162C1_ROSDO|nr:EAL domain-containing protein [Roseobacter denitrificans]ABG33172.1 GGDEF/EAL domain protein [Roseobacter denitrificans OCh 114]AVL52527.1 GGDEF domain-containing protein [Roseobacter denitrificans]SFG29415.1 diguanylate cyclase/phosphodiesterase [Roseobacter denitrificans OCh 114]